MFPYSSDIEKNVLGCILLGKEEALPKLNKADFYDPLCQAIYQAMVTLFDQKKVIDPLTVSDVLNTKDGLELVTGIMLIPSTSERVTQYIAELKNYTARRDVIQAAQKAVKLAEDGGIDAKDLKAQTLHLMDINITTKRPDNSIQSIMYNVMNDIETRYNAKDEERLFTGFYDLDRITAGLHPEEMTILAARPGIGKSAFAIQLMLNLGRKGNKCLFISREMSTIQIGKRILANISGLDGHVLRLCKKLTDEDFIKMGGAVNQITALPVEINGDIATIQEIRAYCKELKVKSGLDVLIVDYLQLVRTLTKKESFRLEINDISRQLKELSLELKIPVIPLSQLSRESVGACEPELHHLKESGSLEQDADNVIFLHIPKETDETQDYFDIKVIIGKQRNGPTGHIWLRYCRKTFKFMNVAR